MKTLELWAFFTPFSSVSTGTYFTTFSSVSTAHCVPPYQFINVEITPALKSTYFVKYFERLLLDRHKMTTENYYHLFEISMVFEWRFTGSVCEFGIRIPGKIASKVNAWKGKVWNFTKNNFFCGNFSKTSRQTVMSTTYIVSCVSNVDINIWRQYIEENQKIEI